MAADERDNNLQEIRVSCKKNPKESEVAVAVDEKRWRADPMVEIELDAARALADFAHFALLQSNNTETATTTSESSRNWGNKRRRSSSSKRVKNQVLCEWGKNFSNNLKLSSTSLSDLLAQESTVEDNQCLKKVRRSMAAKTIKAEQNLEVPATPQCSTSYASSGGGRSKHQLTEAEKEAKRLRRVLANRESARQTIRRRQAICEELTRKAADLALENANMKREKELILKEYLLMKDTNQELKAQIARSTKTKTEETTSIPINELSPSSPEKQLPLLVYSRPSVTPFVWSPIIHPVKTQEPPSNEQVNGHGPSPSSNPPTSTNGPMPPFYIMPCPWFFPIANGLYPPHPLDSSTCSTNKQDDISLLCDPSLSLNFNENIENNPPSPETNTKSPKNILVDTTIRLAPGEELMNVKEEESGSSFQERENNNDNYICHSQKIVDAAVAAEARKRRKELTRLKNLNGRQLRLQC
ncbi:hypothetical protein ACHQM5_021217 [Ranunculus cassubicifolius]